jgi:hypothetical protein
MERVHSQLVTLLNFIRKGSARSVIRACGRCPSEERCQELRFDGHSRIHGGSGEEEGSGRGTGDATWRWRHRHIIRQRAGVVMAELGLFGVVGGCHRWT